MNWNHTFTFAERHRRQALLLLRDATGCLVDPCLERVILGMVTPNGLRDRISEYSSH